MLVKNFAQAVHIQTADHRTPQRHIPRRGRIAVQKVDVTGDVLTIGGVTHRFLNNESLCRVQFDDRRIRAGELCGLFFYRLSTKGCHAPTPCGLLVMYSRSESLDVRGEPSPRS